MKTSENKTNEIKKLEMMSRPLQRYLRKNCNPYASIVITGEQMKVVETVLSEPSEKSDIEHLKDNISTFIEQIMKESAYILQENSITALPAMVHELRELLQADEGVKTQKVIKEVKCDFLTGGKVGCIHVTAQCKDINDLKEVLEFAGEASKLVPLQIENALEVLNNKP